MSDGFKVRTRRPLRVKSMVKDLFAGTAKYYAKYRSGYPDSFTQDVVRTFQLDGQGRLLDLGAGTGQLAIPFARYFEEVVAMDPEPGMVREGIHQAEKAGIGNVRWIARGSDDLRRSIGVFRLVTLGRAYHWMDKRDVLEKLFPIVIPNGGVVIVSDKSFLDRPADFQQLTTAVIKKWLGDRRRAGSGYYRRSEKKFEEYFRRSSFPRFEVRHYPYARDWTIDDIIGFCYSSSFASKAVLGNKAEGFENDLKKSLQRLNPQGKFHEESRAEAFFLFKDA